MNTKTKNVLARWPSLQQDDGLRRAELTVRALWFAGLALFIFVVFGIVYKLQPIAIAVAAAANGMGNRGEKCAADQIGSVARYQTIC